jgi:hypothetical protein
MKTVREEYLEIVKALSIKVPSQVRREVPCRCNPSSMSEDEYLGG